jgi:hypothetical protein
MSTALSSRIQRFKLERSVDGDVTYLALHGVIDEGFEGRKTAEAVRTRKIVISLREVRRFASWGMAEWTEFMKVAASRQVYLVECSGHAVNQFSLVTGLLGRARLVSFYAPLRCGTCSEETSHLVVVPSVRNSWDSVRELQKTCATCGGAARLDKFGSAMVEAVAAAGRFDIDDDVVAGLRARFGYDISPDVHRFRAHFLANKHHAYLRFSGNLSGLDPEAVAGACRAVTVVDLAPMRDQPLEQQGIDAWRELARKATTSQTEALQLLECSPDFMERAVDPAQFPKLQVRSFWLSYHCSDCAATTTRTIDVAEQLEHLVEGIVPTARCKSCKKPLEPSVPPTLLAQLRRLPARVHDQQLDRFIEKARGLEARRLKDALTLRPSEAKEPTNRRAARAMYVVSGIMVAVTAGVLVIALGLWKDRDRAVAAPERAQIVPPKVTPTFQRPEWIIADLPSSSYCHDMVNRLMCVGVSSYRMNRDEAVNDANQAALEELVHTIGLRITEPFFRDQVLDTYSEVRAKAISQLQTADTDRSSADYAAANEVVRAARRRVAESFKVSGGPAVPAQRSDWYWEEYAKEKGNGTEILVFVRYDVPHDTLKVLVERYATPVTVNGSVFMTAFPSLGWKSPSFASGAMVVTPNRSLSSAGVAPLEIVTEVAGQPVSDAVSFGKLLADQAAPSKITVRTPAGASRNVELN